MANIAAGKVMSTTGAGASNLIELLTKQENPYTDAEIARMMEEVIQQKTVSLVPHH